ncbi:MAG: PqqD family protein [Proteobacteria bacterium]|nr:PqqD family protein [Pseudomonadota bacterium]
MSCHYVTLSVDAIAQEVSGETVILDLRSEQYFSLDIVGTRVWQLLQASPDLDAVLSQLLEEFDVKPDRLKADVDALIASLVEEGLATVSEQRE